MLLGARILSGFSSVNSWQETRQQADVTASQSEDVYLQLVDLSQDPGAALPGRRYCPGAAATLAVTLPHMDTTRVVTRSCTRVSSLDTSIWKLQLLASDQLLVGTKSLHLVLVDSGQTLRGIVPQGLRVHGFDTSIT